jgi:hypothetical protein
LMTLLFSQEWWGLIQYEVLDSSIVCRWRESIVSKYGP